MPKSRKIKKSKMPPLAVLTTTREPEHRGRAAGIFPVQAADGSLEYSIQGAIGYDMVVLKALDFLNRWTLTRGVSSGRLNDTAFVRWALAELAARLGCDEHPIPAARFWFGKFEEQEETNE